MFFPDEASLACASFSTTKMCCPYFAIIESRGGFPARGRGVQQMHVSDLVAKLRRMHGLMTVRQPRPESIGKSTAVHLPEHKRRHQVTPHKPADDHRLRASQL